MRLPSQIVMQPAAQRVMACIVAAAVALSSPSMPVLASTSTPALEGAPIVSTKLADTSPAPPSAEAQARLRKAFTAAQAGFVSAEAQLGSSIVEWEATHQPEQEVAALYKTRGGVRLQQGKLQGARDDLTAALRLMGAASDEPDVAEVQRTYQLRARVHAALGDTRAQADDLTAAIERLDRLDAIESTNPYLYAERARARMVLGEYAGAADDSETAEVLFNDIGDKIRRTIAGADGALASYGAGDIDSAIAKMRRVFKVKRTLATNNPDDIALLQELSKKDAELHIAYAAHLYAREGKVVEASRQWESGCVRLDTYIVDGKQRFEEEQKLQEREAAAADAAGKESTLRAASVDTPLNDIDNFRARLNGLDPKSPYVRCMLLHTPITARNASHSHILLLSTCR
jgi:tetratricopeptide (TPR) repeat protein